MPPLEYKQGILQLPEAQKKPIPIAWIMPTGIVNGELSVLAARRKGSTKITFIGGQIELNEDDEFTIVRESDEEAGLKFEMDGFLCPLPPHDRSEPSTRTFAVNGQEYEVYPWMVLLNDIKDQPIQNKQPDKNDDWRWFSLRELINEMVQDNLPSFILDDWLNWTIDGLYEMYGLRPFRTSEVPAYYLEECAEIIEQAKFERFKKQILK